MKPILDKLNSAISEIDALAQQRGLLLGGHMTICAREGDAWVRKATVSFVRDAPAEDTTSSTPPAPPPEMSGCTIATGESAACFTGDICTHCGNGRMVRSGACSKCLDCGESGGCS